MSAGQTRGPYFRWTPAADAAVTTARLAAAVAAELGVSPAAVETRRRRLGYRLPADDFWTAERLQVLRDLTTVAAAARLGVTPSKVSRARQRYDIPGPPAAGGRTGRPKGANGPGPKVLRLAERARALRAEGLTLAAVGERLGGVTREYVRRLLQVNEGAMSDVAK